MHEPSIHHELTAGVKARPVLLTDNR